VVAPVFGPGGKLLLVLSLVPDGKTAQDLPELSRALIRATEIVMDAIDGRSPRAPAQLREQAS
jgi:hypothetical protein